MTSRKTVRFSSLSSKLVGLTTLGLTSFATAGLASAHVTQSQAVLTNGPAIKAVAAGPVTIHAYSGFAGGSLFVAPAKSGTDRDCQTQGAATTRLPADRVTTYAVPAGEVACLATTTKGSFELLWHSVPAPVATPFVLATSKH